MAFRFDFDIADASASDDGEGDESATGVSSSSAAPERLVQSLGKTQDSSTPSSEFPAAFLQGDGRERSADVEQILTILPCHRSDCAGHHLDVDGTFDEVEGDAGALHPVSRCVDVGAGSNVSDIVRTSDLEPGVYEGGFKLWECAVDLVTLLAESKDLILRDRSVLELGCGHALPGLFAAQCGASRVVLQDYNDEVLRSVTEGNLALNLVGEERDRCQLVTGGWRSLVEQRLLGVAAFDVILCSDSIYDERSYQALVDVIIQTMAQPHGIALIAAKNYYFGVGGSMRRFLEVAQASGNLQVRSVATVSDGHSNVREIVELSWRSS